MHLSRKFLALACMSLMLAVFVAGAASAQNGLGHVRFVHAIPGAAAIDIYTDGQLTITNLESGEATLYVQLPAGDHNLTVTQAGVTTMLWEQPISVAADTAQTMVVATTQPLLFQAYPDDLAPLPIGKARFTAIHAIPNGPAVDVVLSDGRPVISGLNYNQAYGTLDLPALAYDLAVVPTGGTVDDALVPAQPYALRSGAFYALLISGTANSPEVTLLEAPVLGDADSAFVRLAHVIPDGPSVDVALDESVVAPGLAFGGDSTEYMAIPAGEYAVSVRDSASAEEVVSGTLQVTTGDRVTVAIVPGEESPEIQTIAADTSAINAQTSVIHLVNAIPGDATAFLALSDGSGLTGDIPSGETTTATVPQFDGSATLSITAGDEPVDVELPLDGIYGGVLYELIAVQGADGPEAVLLDPVSIAQGLASAPGAQAVVVAEATPEATTVVVAAEPTAVPLAEATAEIAQPVQVQPTVAQPTLPPQPTLAPPQPTPGNPTARVLLNPGANLQLRQYPNQQALSLGLAPSGSILIVRGRAGAPQLGPLETPSPDATEFIDPASLLPENEDLNAADTWIFVTYNTPEGGAIDAWVNSLYIALTASDGTPIRLRSLITIPSNRAGTTNGTVGNVSQQTGGDTAQVQPTLQPTATSDPFRNQVVATVNQLSPGSNLQFRRNPDNQSESLALIPAGTQVIVLGRTDAGDWLFIEHEDTTGWIASEYVALTRNGLLFERMDVEISAGNISAADRFATETATALVPTVAPTAESFRAVVAVDAVAMTISPGGDSGGLPVITRDRPVMFFFTTNDLQYSLIQLDDGTLGWVPSYAIIVLE